tara:strand:- start:109 stop:342 length:234 start_codon:yes stop_codon:yes gene_type:complete
MSYKSNPQYLPPKKSADEYEREIAILKLQLREAESTIRRAATSISDEWSDPAHMIASNYSRKTDIDLYVEEIKKKND